MAEKKQDNRTRNFVSILYPESAVENWQEVLLQHCVPAFISPLHENDVNPDGEAKKPHYHIMLMFDNKKTLEQAQEVFNSIGAINCQVVKSTRGQARYLCHLDNPEKAQYDVGQVKNLHGADYISTIGLASDKYQAIAEMQEFCEMYNVTSFFLLSKYARQSRPDWFRILSDCGSVFMREYLKSKEWTASQEVQHIINPETGEILA